jgi:FdhD protein
MNEERVPSQQPLMAKRSIVTFDGQQAHVCQDNVATEYPLTIIVNDEEFATMVCSPDHLEELVVGFLAAEGLIRFYARDIKQMEFDMERGFAYVLLQHKPNLGRADHSKRFIGSCCGKSRQSFYFENDVRTAKTATTRQRIQAGTCLELMAAMQRQSSVFKATGGVHNAAICTEDDIIVSRTDIGRHNALDKLYGYCLIQHIPVRDKVLCFSGRISSEVLLKAAKIGIGIMISKSAPTELALRMADELNMTTIGFVRQDRFNVYTHPERIQF